MASSFQFQALADSTNALLAGKLVTAVALGIYAGNALTYSAVIMPSLRKFSSSSSLAVWTETFNTAKSIQLSALAISTLGSAALYYETKNTSYLISALLMAGSIPYTFATLLPINKKLLAIRDGNRLNGQRDSLKDNKSDDSVVDDLMRRWSFFHLGRTLVGFVSLSAAIYGIISDSGVNFILSK
ncbi:hypothetical protein BGZ98_009905 [Dissophora globulifera]|uniref:DUF1772-domain-containing protein n=1 Tax=Dissophora globulifera TaxID=979702 RepID=A0A9P6RS29_9FUNG|nr:hypothetical protein BGZ98_009905 [Dissophora globulifera]KAG0325329.1 hypothetical protein BGZ99_000785 [Dissophora globulifera]